MNAVSLFAGVGGFDLACERAGMTVTDSVELDPQARQVLANHFPDTRLHDDIRNIDDERFAGADVMVGGFPCQDYSVAGTRGGLAGDRGALWWDFHRLIAGSRPTWVIGENVPGLLSSNQGRDFGTIVGSLVELGYGVVWRVLDAQWFGVPQRRRRVFIAAHSGGRPRPEVLALAESLCGDSTPSRKEGTHVAATITANASGSGSQTDRHDTNVIVGTLTAGHSRGDHAGTETQLVVSSLTASNGGPDDNAAQAGHLVVNARQNPITSLDMTGPIDTDGGTHAVAFDQFNYSLSEDHHTLTVEGKSDLLNDAGVRRLTPLECERLQGFPDNWGAGFKDGPRYRFMGNAVAVPVAEWIMKRITL